MMGVRHTAGSASRRALLSLGSHPPALPAGALLHRQPLRQAARVGMAPGGPTKTVPIEGAEF